MLLEDELVCNFKLAEHVIRDGVGKLVHETNRSAILKGIWWDCVWMATDRSGFKIVVMKQCPLML